jgi:hypothetical protein
MDRRFIVEEFKDVIDEMEKNKAVDLDGISVEYYPKCWDIIKSDLMSGFDDFHHHKIDLDRTNNGTVTSISKN